MQKKIVILLIVIILNILLMPVLLLLFVRIWGEIKKKLILSILISILLILQLNCNRFLFNLVLKMISAWFLVRDQTYLTSLLCCFVVTQEKWTLILAVRVVRRCSVLEKNLHILHMSCLRSQSQSSVSISRHLLHAQLVGRCPGQKMPSNTALLANSHSFVCTLTDTLRLLTQQDEIQHTGIWLDRRSVHRKPTSAVSFFIGIAVLVQFPQCKHITWIILQHKPLPNQSIDI